MPLKLLSLDDKPFKCSCQYSSMPLMELLSLDEPHLSSAYFHYHRCCVCTTTQSVTIYASLHGHIELNCTIGEVPLQGGYISLRGSVTSTFPKIIFNKTYKHSTMVPVHTYFGYKIQAKEALNSDSSKSTGYGKQQLPMHPLPNTPRSCMLAV